MPTLRELSNGPENSIGDRKVNKCFRSLPILLALLLKSLPELGQQATAPTLESLVAEARQAQGAHDYAAAEKAYKQAVRVEPNMAELWSNLGLMQQETGDMAAAIPSFQQANRLNPSLFVPNLFLGNDYLRTGKALQAIPFLIKAERTNKSDPQAALALGHAYYATGKFSPATLEFARATTLDPKLGAAWFSLGIAHLDLVEEEARSMTGEAPHSPYAQALYAESLEKQARFNEAATVYRGLLASQPQPPCLRSALGFSLLRHRDLAGAANEFAAERAAHPECGLALLGQARIAIDGGDNEKALKLLDELWERDHNYFVSNAGVLLEGLPDSAASAVAAYLSQPAAGIPPDLHDALLGVFDGGGHAPDAPLDRADLREPGAPVSAVRRTAEEYYAAGEFERCAQRLDPVLDAKRAEKLRLLAACAFFAGNSERAIAAATAIEALEPHSAEALYWSIQAHKRLALESLARFQQLESNSARSHVLLGDIYNQLERFDDAQAEYSKALDIAPGDAAATLGLALAYLSNNNLEKAMETARAALEHNAQDPELNLVVAETMVAKRQFAGAEPYLMKSLNVKPQMLGHVHALMGKVDAETGRTKDAIDQLKLGESSDEDGSVHYLLARLYRQSGDTKEATAALDQVKTIKQRRLDRSMKTIEDPDLSSLETPHGPSSTP